MVRIFWSMNVSEVYVIRDLLENSGIEVVIMNEESNRLPPLGLTGKPAVWVSDNAKAQRAKKLIAEFEEQGGWKREDSSKPLAPWVCGNCGEENDASFEFCWKCQMPPRNA